VANPGQVRDLTALCRRLAQGRQLVIALEPTGTYGDPLRQALHDADLAVQRVSPKVAHDYAEVFDGVPSQHDGKDAALLAELAALGKSVLWPFVRTPRDQELAYWVERLEGQRRFLAVHYGRLEGLLARHWPEAAGVLSVSSGVLLRCLQRYGSPAALAADPDALRQLRRWGGPRLSEETARALLAGATASVGVRAEAFDVRRLQEQAAAARQLRQELGVSRRRLEALASTEPVLEAQAQVVGAATACVLWVGVGDPRDYDCGAAYRKAMGLNLTERSSGRWQGRIHISGRGPAVARRWLYFAALRLVRRAGVRDWYQRKKSRDGDLGGRALIGVMRKLALALYRVGAKGEPFAAGRLFASGGRKVS
jgi:transposase